MITSPQTTSIINPTEGLVQYVQAIKPYHTKILDVLTEYVYTDHVLITMRDVASWDMVTYNIPKDTVYVCNTGWTSPPPYDSVLMAEIISATTVDAAPISSMTGFIVGTQLTIVAVDYGVLNVGYPLIGPGVAFNTLVVSQITPLLGGETLGGVGRYIVSIFQNIGFTDAIGNHPYNVSNSFLVQPATSVVWNGSIQLPLATYTTVVSNVVDGQLTLSPSLPFGFPTNPPAPTDGYPSWPVGTKVTLTTTGTLPSPLVIGTTYYFIPSATIGVFSLANTPYPTAFGDYVHVNTLGTGILTIHRAESFLPGSSIRVESSAYGENNGEYSIIKVAIEGTNTRVYVAEQVPYDTPLLLITDGYMTQRDVALQPHRCLPAQTSDLYVAASITERIVFDFLLQPADMIPATIVDIRPVGYGMDQYSAGEDGGFGNVANVEKLAGTVVGSGTGDAFTLKADGLDLDNFDE